MLANPFYLRLIESNIVSKPLGLDPFMLNNLFFFG